MNGKAVQGPNGGPSFKLLVEVARPIGKNKKRARDDPQIKPASKISSHSKFSKDEQIFSTSGGLKSGAQEIKYSLEEPLVADPYEAAVVSLPVAESSAISILDQFMLSGADRLNKGEYLAALISRGQHQVDRLGLNHHALNLSRIDDITSKESQLSSFSSRVHHSAVDPLSSRMGTTMSGYGTYASRYSSPFSTHSLSTSRVGFGRMEETSPVPLHRTPASSTSYGKVGLDSTPISSVASDRQPTRAQVRFDPFTGEPYKFDPFTGEPIVPESITRRFGSPY